MKKSLLIIVVLLAAAVAALLFVRSVREHRTSAGGEAPAHVFLPLSGHIEADIRCDFTDQGDRSTMTEMWRAPLQACSLGDGWTYPSPGGVVAMARRSTFDIDIPAGEWSMLLMKVKAFQNPDAVKPQTMTVQLNGSQVGTVEVPQSWATVQLALPRDALREGSNRFAATFGYRVSPTGEGRKKDPRLFAVHLREVFVVRGRRSELSKTEIARIVERHEALRADKSLKFDSDSGRFAVSGPGTLILPAAIPVDAERLVLDVETRHARRGGGPRIELRVRSLSSDAAVGPVTPSPSEGGGRNAMAMVADVRQLAGETCMLTVDVTPRSRRATVLLSAPRFDRTPAATTRDAEGPEAPSLPTSRPDIVMITLDAARAGNFSCYGYGRETTPNIDRLAAESLVFRHAFALAPYTLCSVPTMVTGLSFLDHRITTHGQRLADGATTLAEYLQASGYRTACFSASPNNSRALGTDQGYGEFVETWKVVQRPDSADPFLLSRMAVDWLAAQDGSVPLHLQLHFVPPHAPYTPGEAYDRFTDPAYRGPCNGEHETIGALDSGLWVPTAADLAHVLALYDGNLRRGDAAVGQVLDALMRRPRWRDTVVIVTSDHGEGFLEHGRMSHNSTVFDEMLHVPFILRLPGNVDPGAVDLDGLASLADIVPTLLATAGLEAEPGVSGVNLLGPPDPQPPAHGRYLVMRTAGDPPLYALRTARWKLMLSGSGQGSLFNVDRDPEERRDLSLQARLLFAGLGQLLTERLAAAPRFEPVAEADALDEEDTEMLKALGYVQ